jgi:hypothetical protein
MTLIMLEQIVVGLFLGSAIAAWVASTRPEKIKV